jgi:hypothetical protein
MESLQVVRAEVQVSKAQSNQDGWDSLGNLELGYRGGWEAACVVTTCRLLHGSPAFPAAAS